ASRSLSVISGGRSPSRRFFSFMGCAISPPKRLVASRLDIVCSARKFSRNFFRRSGFASPVVKSACRLPRRRAKSHTPGTSEAARPGPPPNFSPRPLPSARRRCVVNATVIDSARSSFRLTNGELLNFPTYARLQSMVPHSHLIFEILAYTVGFQVYLASQTLRRSGQHRRPLDSYCGGNRWSCAWQQNTLLVRESRRDTELLDESRVSNGREDDCRSAHRWIARCRVYKEISRHSRIDW